MANERLTRFTRNDGLHDNGVFQILEDPAGYFWMGSNRGISRVSRRELNDFAEGRRRSVNAVAFGPVDGLASVEVNGGAQPSGLAAADGTLWFPTMGGVAVLNPAELRRPGATPPPAIVEEVRLNGEPIELHTERDHRAQKCKVVRDPVYGAELPEAGTGQVPLPPGRPRGAVDERRGASLGQFSRRPAGPISIRGGGGEP